MKTHKNHFGEFGCLVTSDSKEDVSSLPTDEVRALLKENGVLLFRGFDMNLEKFVSLTDRFSEKFLKHIAPSLRPPLTEDKTVTDVLTGNNDVYLHGEMYYLPRKPDILWLYCTLPSSKGGQTTVCDGTLLFRSLKPSTRKMFESKKVKYNHIMTKQQWIDAYGTQDPKQAIQAIANTGIDPQSIKFHPDESITFHHIASAVLHNRPERGPVFINSIVNMTQYSDRVQVTFEDGQPIPQEVINEIHETGERVTALVEWQPGDVIMVDNSWIMHGRRAFSGARKVASRFSLAA